MLGVSHVCAGCEPCVYWVLGVSHVCAGCEPCVCWVLGVSHVCAGCEPCVCWVLGLSHVCAGCEPCVCWVLGAGCQPCVCWLLLYDAVTSTDHQADVALHWEVRGDGSADDGGDVHPGQPAEGVHAVQVRHRRPRLSGQSSCPYAHVSYLHSIFPLIVLIPLSSYTAVVSFVLVNIELRVIWRFAFASVAA